MMDGDDIRASGLLLLKNYIKITPLRACDRPGCDTGMITLVVLWAQHSHLFPRSFPP